MRKREEHDDVLVKAHDRLYEALDEGTEKLKGVTDSKELANRVMVVAGIGEALWHLPQPDDKVEEAQKKIEEIQSKVTTNRAFLHRIVRELRAAVNNRNLTEAKSAVLALADELDSEATVSQSDLSAIEDLEYDIRNATI